MCGVAAFRLLGPVEVWQADQRFDVGDPKQRSVLAVLLVEANQTLSTGALIDRVWGAEHRRGG